MEKGEPIITCSGLHREYRMGAATVKALRGVDVEVVKGEILVVLGPSGAGKSTLLHVMGALDRPSSGIVKFGDRDLSRLSEGEAARIRGQSFGFVFQFHHLIPELSVLENVMSPGMISRSGGRDLQTRAMELLNELEMTERAKHMPSQISGGERQRVAVARAMFNDPEIIFTDEPTGNLDTATGKLIMDLIAKLNREKDVTFVTVTHDESFSDMATRTIRLVDGTIQT